MVTAPADPLNARVEDLEVFADDLDPQRAAAIYREYGALVVRGLMKPYVAALERDIEATAAQSISLLDRAKQVTEGWTTPDGTLFLPAPPGVRDQLIVSYTCDQNSHCGRRKS